MRRILPILFALSVLVAFVGTLAFLWTRAAVPEVELRTETAETRDIIVKTVATGSVTPRREIAVKSAVSGVVAAIAVEAGEIIAEGDLIATIRVVPDAASLARAEADLAQRRISRRDAQAEHDRVTGLSAKGATSAAEVEDVKTVLALARQSESAARIQLQIVRDGASGNGQVSTEVRAPVGGMVLDVSVEVGTSVIEANTFNEGTTIAALADMTDMIFEGLVDESEVGRIAEGMPLDITIGALDELEFSGVLEHIAPKGVEEQGAVQFPIRAALELKDGVFVRAGLSANADIVLDRAMGVLAIREAVLSPDGGSVQVMVAGVPEARAVELGLSDGIWVTVTSGIEGEELIVLPEGAGGRGRPGG